MRFDQIGSLAFRVGRITGITIRIHLILIVFWLFELDRLLGWEADRLDVLFLWLLGIGLVFGSILLHEFGHAFAARAVGGSADEIVLWPLGGLAYCRAPNLPRSQFIVAAGGPAVTLAIALVSWGVFTLVGEPPSPKLAYYTRVSRRLLVDFQLILFVFNAVPMYPLDGGRMFQALLWGWYERRGRVGAYGRASLFTVYVSRVCQVLLVVYAVLTFRLFLLFLAVFAWMETEGLYRRLREGASADGVFGYDFSRGYTSVEGSMPRSRAKGPGFFARWGARRRERARRRVEASSGDRERVDELLAKIQRDGMPSLTREERKFLERVSKRF